MKKLIIIPLFLITSLLSGQKYYISPTGSDATGDGSIGTPWFSLTKGALSRSAGDTVFIRGGTYAFNTQQTINVSGTQGNEIVFINYEDEVPIFDFYTYDVSGESPKSIYGIYSISDSYIKIQGITVKRVWKINTNNGRAHGFYIQSAHHFYFTKCIADSIAGRGFQNVNSRDIFHYNCDATWCADPQDADPGNAGTGFLNTGVVNQTMDDTVLYEGCRAWYCADQGFGSDAGQFTIYNRCWAFANGLRDEGYTSGGQQGMKPGYTSYDIDPIQVLITNCLIVYNGGYGLNENTGSTGYKINFNIFNNIFYKNGSDGIFTSSYTTNLDNQNLYINNISYDNGRYDMYMFQSADHSYNSFDNPYCPTCAVKLIVSPATVSDADFIDVPADEAECITVLGASRQEDGSLPDIGDHFKLAEGSDLIGIGLGVGLVYDGAGNYHNEPPDLGPFAYDATEPEPPNLPEVTSNSITSYSAFMATLGGTITSDGGGTLTASGIVWDTEINPTLSDNVIQAYQLTEDSFSVVLRNIGGGKVIYVRAFATNETGTSYGANLTLTTPDQSVLKSPGGKYYVNDGNILIFK